MTNGPICPIAIAIAKRCGSHIIALSAMHDESERQEARFKVPLLFSRNEADAIVQVKRRRYRVYAVQDITGP